MSDGFVCGRRAARGLADRVRLVLLALALVMLAPARALAAFEVANETWEGTSQLLEVARDALGKDRVKVVAELDYSVLTKADGVLILHPVSNLDYADLTAFLVDGGRVALLDDYGSANHFLDHFTIYRISAPFRPQTTLHDNPNLAVAVPAIQLEAGKEQGPHPIVQGVEEVVTNHPTGLAHNHLTPVLVLRSDQGADVTLALTGVVTRGRLFAMGDPSAVINLMMRYPGNRLFAQNLVKYLVEDADWGPRGGSLYIVANDFAQTGHATSNTSRFRDVQGVVDDLSEALADLRQNGLPESVALMLAVTAALGAVVWTLTAATRTYRPVVPRYASAVPLVAQGGVAGRAAVLAAPTTHRALAALELKTALEEQLGARLGLPRNQSAQAILTEIDRQQALSRRSSVDLQNMLADLNRLETLVIASQAPRVDARELERLRQRVAALVAEIDAKLGRKR